jgi:4-amino-4-deoxy-L-arabinose transferase-like glycosyltransferase
MAHPESHATGLPDTSPERSPFLFAIVVALILFGTGLLGAARDHYYEQVPLAESALLHRDAVYMLHAAQDRGIEGIGEAWVFTNRTSPPLVPALAACTMLLFGESRRVAELCMPAFVFLYIYSAVRIFERFYRGHASRVAVALAASFPAFIQHSRFFVNDLPGAALVLAAVASLVNCRGFLSWRESLQFAVFAGLAALADTVAAAALAPPFLIYLATQYKNEHPLWRSTIFLTAVGIVVFIAGSWYGPNAHELFGRAGSRPDAAAWAGGIAAAVLDGPGLPLLAIGAGSLLAAFLSRGTQAFRGGAGWAIAGVVVLHLCILQILGSRLDSGTCLAVLPAAGIGVVRALATIRGTAVRWLCNGLCGALACFSFAESALFFPTDGPPGLTAVAGVPLWRHESLLFTKAGGAERVLVNYRFRDLMHRIDELNMHFRARIVVLSNQPFVSAAGLQYFAMRTRRPWVFEQAPPLSASAGATDAWNAAVLDMCRRADAVLWFGGRNNDVAGDAYRAVVATLCAMEPDTIELFGEPMPVKPDMEYRTFRNRR